MKAKKLFALILILILLMWIPLSVYAEIHSNPNNNIQASRDDSGSPDDDSDDSIDDSDDSDDDSDSIDDSDSDDILDDSISTLLLNNPEYLRLIEQKKQLSTQIKTLQSQLKTAKDAKDEVAERRLESQIRYLKNQKDAVEAQIYQLGGVSLFKPHDSVKNISDNDLSLLKNQRDTIEKELSQLREAVSSGAATDLNISRARILELEKQKDELAIQIRTKKEEIKNLLRNLYTDKEWQNLNTLVTQLNEQLNTSALPVNSILIQGQKVKFDAPPIIINGRVLIPVRSVTTALGATVAWDDSNQEVTIIRNNISLEFEIGDDSMKINGKSIPLDVPAQIVNGRMVVPLRALVEKFGLVAEWDEVSKIVDIQ